MFLRLFCALSLSVLIISCGRYDKQYSKIVSDNEFKSTRVQCYTVFNLPFFCLITEEYERTFKVIEIVEKIVEIVVEREVEIEKVIRVHTQTIAREVYEVFRDKEVDIETIVSTVIEKVYDKLPRAVVIPVAVHEVASQVVSEVIESTPYTPTDVVIHTSEKTTQYSWVIDDDGDEEIVVSGKEKGRKVLAKGDLEDVLAEEDSSVCTGWTVYEDTEKKTHRLICSIFESNIPEGNDILESNLSTEQLNNKYPHLAQ